MAGRRQRDRSTPHYCLQWSGNLIFCSEGMFQNGWEAPAVAKVNGAKLMRKDACQKWILPVLPSNQLLACRIGIGSSGWMGLGPETKVWSHLCSAETKIKVWGRVCPQVAWFWLKIIPAENLEVILGEWKWLTRNYESWSNLNSVTTRILTLSRTLSP